MKIKFLEQPDEKDCGPTCLAMLSKYWGKNVSIAKIREYTKTDLYGTNVLGMIQGGKKIGLDIEGFKAESFDDLYKISTPFIIHVVKDNQLEHFVIIEKIKKDKVYIIDPAYGRSVQSQEELLKSWSKVVLTVEKNKEFNTVDNSPSFYKFFKEMLFSNKKYIMIIFLCSIFISIISIIGSFYFKFLVDDIIPTNIIGKLNNLSLGILVLYICYLILSYIRYQLILKMGLKISKTLMLDYYNHILTLPKKFFETRKEGEILSRFRDTEYIREAFSSITVTLIMDMILVCIGGVILFSQSIELFFVVLVLIPIYIGLVIFFKGPFEKYNREEMEANSELSSQFIEGVRGIDVLKSHTSESLYFKKIRGSFEKLLNKAYVLGKYSNIQLSIKDFMGLFTILIILWIGSFKVMDNQLSLGELLTFNALVVYFIDPLERLIQSQLTIQSAIVATRRVVEILDLEKEQSLKLNNIENIESIKIDSLGFNYGYRNEILKNININIKKNTSTAIIGESGSGKSTLVKLLLKYYSPSSGKILINNSDITNISTQDIRKCIGYVPQAAFLFFGSIKDNLTLNRNDTFKDSEIIRACKIAKIHDFIINLPQGYNTILENNGENLSGGQKQRIEIARAILKNPDVLILDEPTSSLDVYTSQAIIDNILMLNITTIVITHEINLIENFDEIITMSEGKVVT
ncbi:peptidase domain-containing ABC transporter [Staphylococcus warneri]|uniref:peptidase domain-containing ABC transporter n=1 Tax=Staphylococcus warneri TaxID=1292 RepID=UPI001881A17D|nr:peptidase domain-containing ABC transporter [Staphylococcus epidermidis]MCJ1788148.1 peptidase domain-containing ABC transporter [Staphylococcus warneri]MCJ1790550.1 peptidase domain-containing ABC transporter [Staphylococcus warneri]MCJ1793023.1 peptidase domain-containing ABC transporter [Staphylococcus warneri]MCJ1795484.1 peptidase domain-containing ABC transporter [Staphylococcus warneri]